MMCRSEIFYAFCYRLQLIDFRYFIYARLERLVRYDQARNIFNILPEVQIISINLFTHQKICIAYSLNMFYRIHLLNLLAIKNPVVTIHTALIKLDKAFMQINSLTFFHHTISR